MSDNSSRNDNRDNGSVFNSGAGSSTFSVRTDTSWNLDAPEFIPGNISAFNSTNSNANQSAFYEMNEPWQNYESEYVEENPVKYWSEDVLEQMEQSIVCIIDDPGSLDDVLEPLTQSLDSSPQTSQVLEQLLDMLLYHCIYENNFHYTGARLCNHLAVNLKQPMPTGSFRQQFMNRLEQEHQRREEMMQSPEGLQRVCGFTVFVAELLNCMMTGTSRGAFFSKAIPELLDAMLGKPQDVTVMRTVMQVLKLTGGILDHPGNVANLDGILERIKKLLVCDDTLVAVKRMLLPVVELRARSWGTRDKAMASEVVPAPVPIYDEQSGQIWSENDGYGDVNFGAENFDYLDDDYDNEYEQFLLEQQQRLGQGDS